MSHMRRTALLLSLVATTAHAAPLKLPPQVTCRASKTTWVDASTLSVQAFDRDGQIFEIEGDRMFITDTGRPRYMYNIIEPGSRPGLFISGDFRLFFTAEDAKATIVLSNEQVVRVALATCRQRAR
jgi:hypothetical protein